MLQIYFVKVSVKTTNCLGNQGIRLSLGDNLVARLCHNNNGFCLRLFLCSI